MKVPLTDQKLRGGYYTPSAIADFLARWAIRAPDDAVLEPSCGDGNLLEAAGRVLLERGTQRDAVARQLVGVEFDSEEADKSQQRLIDAGLDGLQIVRDADFFSLLIDSLLPQPLLGIEGRSFDAVIGNPPFIRYQNFPEGHRNLAFQAMRSAGLHPNRLTNAWATFLVTSALLLNGQGRLAMVIPAELFQVGYAAEIREYLTNIFHRITIVTFRRLVFDGIQQEIVLLLCEKDGVGGEGVRVVELEDASLLASFQFDTEVESELKPMDHSSEKWTQYFLATEEILLLRKLRTDPRLTLSGDVLDVDVGVVTGDNSFFILKGQEAEDLGLSGHTLPVVTRSSHLSGATFSREDWCSNVERQYPAFLLNAPSASSGSLPSSVQNYVHSGEERAVNQGYKCRIRKQWYVVPGTWVPEAFMLRQVHGFPKLVLNQAGATCTDTIHRVRFRGGANGRMVIGAFLNSLTFAFSEVVGRSYGGGVLTFEPSEAENLPLPLQGMENLDLDQLDALLRSGDIEAILDITDDVLLKQGLGMEASEIACIRTIWRKMRDRRIYRR